MVLLVCSPWVLGGGGLIVLAVATWYYSNGEKRDGGALGGRSAIQDSIARLGESSYYYAHKRKEWEGQRKTQGGAPPLLRKSATPPTKRLRQLKRFSFADSPRRVEVFVDMRENGWVPEADDDAFSESDFSLRIDEHSVVFCVRNEWVLRLDPLFGALSNATLKRRKGGKVKLVLTKRISKEWTSLTAAAR